MPPTEQTPLRSPLRKLPVELRLMIYERIDNLCRPPRARFLDISYFLNLFDVFPDLWQDLSAFTQTINIGALRRQRSWVSKHNLSRATRGPNFEGPEIKIVIKRAWWPLQACCYDTHRLRLWLRTRSATEDFETRTCYDRMVIQIKPLLKHQSQVLEDGVGEVLLIPHSSGDITQYGSVMGPSCHKMSDYPIMKSGFLQKRPGTSKFARDSASG
ncbi:hypothetical protein BST61_g8406 [Cercospora zeina]